jgi:hypothetical protein
MGNEEDILSKGSIYINNTSYSGADIKVLVHTYDPNTASGIQRKAIENETKIVQNQQDAIQGRIASLEAKLETAHVGTPSETRIKKKLDRERKDLDRVDDILSSLKLDDTLAEFKVVTGAVKTLAELQTLSISVYRDKQDVRALGSVYPKGFTRGPRSIAGSMIFTVFHTNVLEEFMSCHSSEFDGVKYTSAIIDQIPPLDVTVVFANETGHLSRMAIYGLEFQTEGLVLSSEDIITESTLSFIARDFDPMRSVAERKIDENYRLSNQWTGQSASSLIFENDAWEEKSLINPFERFSRRNDPFV